MTSALATVTNGSSKGSGDLVHGPWLYNWGKLATVSGPQPGKEGLAQMDAL